MSDKTVLITGATGWIGRFATDILREKGYRVRPFLGDMLEDVNFLPSATHLLHLAWITTPGIYWESPDNIAWFEGSLKLFQEFKESGGHRIVVAGSCAEEVTSTLYGRAKNDLRVVLESYSDITGINSAWGRIFYLYGPHEKPDRLVSSTIISLLRGREVVVNKPSQMVDFFHVEDVAGALCAILDSDVSGTVPIGSGRPITLIRVVQMIAEIMGCPELIKSSDIDEPLFIRCDPRRLTNEVGFTPKYDMQTGLANTIEWWKQQVFSQINKE